MRESPVTVQDLLDAMSAENNRLNERFVEACRKVGFDMLNDEHTDLSVGRNLNNEMQILANMRTLINLKMRNYGLFE